VEVHIIPGNHDGGVEKILPKGVNVHKSAGFAGDDVYFSHGHTWPEKSFLTCEHIIVGHRHHAVEFRDKLGYRFLEQVWLRGKLLAGAIEKKYKTIPEKLPEIIVMPSFNPLVKGGHPLNKKSDESYKRYMGPLIGSINYGEAGLYLLDGTYLGTLSEIEKGQS
jgi:metallophosphoesterase superfamily enzyme